MPKWKLAGCVVVALSSAGFGIACVGDRPIEANTVAPPDGQPPDTASLDAGSDRPLCDLDAKFDTPVDLAVVNELGQNTSARLTGDELTLYMASNREGSERLYVATRPMREQAFSTPTPLAVDAGKPMYDPALSPDGQSLVFAAGAPGDFDLWLSGRDGGAFEEPRPLLAESGDGGTRSDFQPFWVSDGQELWFTSGRSRDTGLGDEIYRAKYAAGTVTDVQRVAEVSSYNDEANPVLSADGRTLYFASNRNDVTLGGYDVWMARRDSTGGTFGQPSHVRELSSDDGDRPSWLSPDGCRIYLTRCRNQIHDDCRIMVASRPPRR